MNAILQNKPFKKNYLTGRKVEIACLAAASLRWDGGRLFFNLHTETAYDPSPKHDIVEIDFK